jgi:hypothetical protein
MKPFKMAAMTIVAGAGLALASAQAFAVTDCGPSANCTSTTSAEVSAGTSSGESNTTLLKQSTTGTGTTSSSTNDGSTISLGGTTSSSDAVAGSFLGTNSLANSSASSQFGLIHEREWNKVGGSTESSSGGSGESLAAVFVFGQNIVVHEAGLHQDSGTNDTAGITTSFNSVAGVLTANQTAGVGNQQANLFATVQELNGSSTGPNSGSNAINVTDGQNLIVVDAGVSNTDYVHGTVFANCEALDADDCTESQVQPLGDVAGITGSFASVVGSVALNQSVGVANQQVNSIMLAH